MRFGGFLGVRHSPECDTALAGYRTGIAEEHINDAPEFSDDS